MKARKTKEISIVAGKNISLIGFGGIDKSEINSVSNILALYIKKVEDRIDYNELKIRLKQHQKNKVFMHELEAELLVHPGLSFNAKETDKNLYKAISKIMSKLLNKISHEKKKSFREKPIKKLIKPL